MPSKELVLADSISIHAPLTEGDEHYRERLYLVPISIHAPLTEGDTSSNAANR